MYNTYYLLKNRVIRLSPTDLLAFLVVQSFG